MSSGYLKVYTIVITYVNIEINSTKWYIIFITQFKQLFSSGYNNQLQLYINIYTHMLIKMF